MEAQPEIECLPAEDHSSEAASDIYEEEEEFIQGCKELDALSPNYDQKAKILLDTVQNAVEANGRLFYMVSEGLKTMMEARKDEVQALNEEHTSQLQAILSGQAKIKELEEQLSAGGDDTERVRELEALLEISEAERGLLEKKLALAGRRQGEGGDGTLLENQQLYSRNQELALVVEQYQVKNQDLARMLEQYQVKNQDLSLVVEQYQVKNQELTLTLEQVHARSQESQAVAGQLQMAYNNAMAENAQLQQTLQGARQQVASFIQHTPPQDRNKLLLELATARSESMKLKEKLESAERECSEKLDRAKERLDKAEREFRERQERMEQELRLSKESEETKRSESLLTKERLETNEMLCEVLKRQVQTKKDECELLKQSLLSRDEDFKSIKEVLRQDKESAEIERLRQELAGAEKSKAEEIEQLRQEMSSMAERSRAESAEHAKFYSLKAEKLVSELKRAHEAELANFRSQKAGAKICELQAVVDQLKEEVELHKRKRDEAASEAKATRALQRQQEDELFKTTKIMAEQDKKIAELEVKIFVREEEKPCSKQSEPKAKNAKCEPDLQKKIDTLSAERASLHSKLAKAEASEQRLAKEVRDLKDEIEIMTQKVKNAEKLNEDHPKQVERLQMQVHMLKSELANKTVSQTAMDELNASLVKANEKLKNALAPRSEIDDRDHVIATLKADVAQLRASLDSNQASLASLERYSCVQIAQVFSAGACLLSAFRGQQVMPALVFGFLDKEFPDHFGVIKKKLHESPDRQQRFLEYVLGPRKDGPQEIATFKRIMKILDVLQAKGCIHWGAGPAEMMCERLANHTKMVIDLMVNEKIFANMNLDSLHDVQENVKMQLFYFAIKGKEKLQARKAEYHRALENSHRLLDEIDAMEEKAAWCNPDVQSFKGVMDQVHERLDQFTPEDFKTVDQKLDENFHEGFLELAKTLAKKDTKKKKGEKDPFADLQDQKLLTTFTQKPIMGLCNQDTQKPIMGLCKPDAQNGVKIFYVNPQDAASTLRQIEAREAREIMEKEEPIAQIEVHIPEEGGSEEDSPLLDAAEVSGKVAIYTPADSKKSKFRAIMRKKKQ